MIEKAHLLSGWGLLSVCLSLGASFCSSVSQVSRRLYECLFVAVQSKTASMFLLHFIYGLMFYFFVAISPFSQANFISKGFSPNYLSGGSFVFFSAMFAILV